MNIVQLLLKDFFYHEQFNTIFMVLTSFLINILQTNGISFITANIINDVQRGNKNTAYFYYKFFIAISITFIILFSCYKYFQNKLMTKLRQWIRQQLVNVMLTVNNENFSEMNFTKLNSPINRISSITFMIFNDIITFLIPNVTFLTIIALYFLYKNKTFGTGFILGNIIIILYLVSSINDMSQHNNSYEKHVTDTESYLQEILNNIDKIIYRGEVDNEINIFSDKTSKSIQHSFNFYSNTTFHGIIMLLIVYSIIFLSIGYLIYLYFNKQIDATTFIAFFTIMLLYRDRMMSIINQIPDFIEFMGRTDSVLKHFKDMENYYDVKDKIYDVLDLEFKTIRFENVTYKYKTGDSPVFENTNITLHTDNKIIGITGLSGNGKSTFAKLVLKLYKCNSGTIYIDDKNISDIDPYYIRKNIIYVNQSSKLFDIKVVENMLYGCEDPQICKEYLNEIMKYDKIKELYRKIDIYNKQSGALGENLSGGQRQVVNIISGLVNPSKILILDEPTNALDIDLKLEVLQIIRDFRKYKKCIIIITHDKDVYGLFDEKLQL
jgi:ABC-type multidrug transport system fused ATPase/permease subunit